MNNQPCSTCFLLFPLYVQITVCFSLRNAKPTNTSLIQHHHRPLGEHLRRCRTASTFPVTSKSFRAIYSIIVGNALKNRFLRFFCVYRQTTTSDGKWRNSPAHMKSTHTPSDWMRVCPGECHVCYFPGLWLQARGGALFSGSQRRLPGPRHQPLSPSLSWQPCQSAQRQTIARCTNDLCFLMGLKV